MREKNIAESIAVKGFCRKFMLTTNSLYFNDIPKYYFISYIRAAGGPYFHWNRCLSLLIYGACRFLFAPTSTHLLTSNSNDK